MKGQIYEQKRVFIKMLKRNNISYNELSQKDKEIELYPTQTLLMLEDQPNTKNLFGRFKETYVSDVVVKMNDIQLVTLTETQLIDAFVKLDEEKINVGE